MRSFNQLLLSAGLALALTAPALSGPALAAEEVELPKLEWPHAGYAGKIDQAAARRGFQVYKEICSSCHSLNLAYFRDLAGIGISAEEIKGIALQYQFPDGPNDKGEFYKRPGLPSDHFPKPFPNEAAARYANNGALPPDLSVIIKARKGGEDYVVNLLTGYEEPPEGFQLAEGRFYNKWFGGNQIGMPQMIVDGGVTYADGSDNSAKSIAHDVATFLVYVSDPHQDERKQLGQRVIIFLVLLSGLLYAAQRRLWAKIDH